MVKGIDKKNFSCISRKGKYKSRWEKAEDAIKVAKKLNIFNNYKDRKLVVYKCPNCFHFHLTTKFKKK